MRIPKDSELTPEALACREEIRKEPMFDHSFKIGVLCRLIETEGYSEATQEEALYTIDQYKDRGIDLGRQTEVRRMAAKGRIPMTMSGFCAHPSEGSHERCAYLGLKCTCGCHQADRVYAGKGIVFAVMDDREKLAEGSTTISTIADAIEEALDNGQETSDQIARYLTTNAFQHVPDKRVRFNAVLKASDVVGAQITRKLYNAYNELAQTADEATDVAEKKTIRDEARGFAEAIQVVISPFSSEDKNDPRLVDWDEVDHMTELFEKEQRLVRKERDGNPQ